MEYIATTSDAPGWTAISEIREELNGFNTDVMKTKYSDIPIRFFFCFRCLTNDSGWESKARLDSSDKCLDIDIVVFYSQFVSLKNDRDAQRKLMGSVLFPFFAVVIRKYSKKVPYLKEYGDDLVNDLRHWLLENNWLFE